MWDTKAVEEACETELAVLPQHLRPAPYNAMRLTYLDHLGVSSGSTGAGGENDWQL
jgi:hypothetical protein